MSDLRIPCLDSRSHVWNSSDGSGGGAAEEGEETGGLRGILLVEEKILRHAECTVKANGGDAEHESGNEDGADASEEDDEDGERGEDS